MQLTEHKPGNHHVIRRVESHRITVDQTSIESSFILGARLLQPDWPVATLDDLDEARCEALLSHQPEVVIIGFGERQSLFPPSLQAPFHRQGIGVECMTLAAAARTFNILMSENRRALAAMILPRD
ncbi:MAG: Mth938-like domain-containing protein [Wenzhouxiangella sp.]